MTERKPPGVSFESWVDRQVRRAEQERPLRDLPDAGKPLQGLDGPYDELWWVKEKLRREQVSVLPPSLAVRKAGEDLLASLGTISSEVQVRRLVASYNERVADLARRPDPGPAVVVRPLRVEDVLDRWELERSGAAAPAAAPGQAGETGIEATRSAGQPGRVRWWRRRRRS
ncbi:MAG: DUF1992 domain-containing protein [Motilibacteraceae bacterium]